MTDDKDLRPIEVKTHPFQQTSQPQEFNVGIGSSALFIGMIYVLIPIILAVDMVYDREVSVVQILPNTIAGSTIIDRMANLFFFR